MAIILERAAHSFLTIFQFESENRTLGLMVCNFPLFARRKVVHYMCIGYS